MGVLNFIIFGLKTRSKEHGAAYPLHCPNCDNDEIYHAIKQRRWFHIFWVPLIPLRATRSLVCPTCGVALDLKKSEYKAAKELADKTRLHAAGEISAEQYRSEVNAFDAEASFIDETEPVAAVDQHDTATGSESATLDSAATDAFESTTDEQIRCDECGALNPERALHCTECNAVVDDRVQ
jgi:phage terminase large subunit GpA-like protein